MSFDLILFGGTGDLVWRKIMPALFQAFRHGSLPEGGRIVGVARDDLSDDQYRALIKSRFDNVELAKRPSEEEFSRFAALLGYLRMDLSNPADYAALAAKLQQRPADVVVMYMATAPSLFTTVCEQIAAAGLNGPQTRVVLEKPLGHDLASNRAINKTVRSVLSEQQIFRIDHYLGKPSVQNLFALRFGNSLFEPLWRRETIANIQITMAEDLGVEKRGAFYDSTGALRDMVQNHALQLLCAIGMEPPINSHADAIRDEKLKVLRSLKAWTPETLSQHVVRGQYAAGNIDGEAVPGYRDEKGVNPESRTETFVALRTEIANWRWAGVPFYIRTGKRLAGRDAHIEVNFPAGAACDFQDLHGRRQRGQPAGDQPAAQGRPGIAFAGAGRRPALQQQPRARHALAGAGTAGPGLRQALWLRTCGRLRTAAAGCDRRAAQPLCAQRRTGRSLALGRTHPGQLEQIPARRGPMPPAAGGRVRRAR
jgi:glucose-6-phosphate 1-dehydrogenase